MKFPQYIGLLALCLLIASCSSGSSSVSDSSDEGWTEVSVTIGERSGGSAAQGPELFPASIETFRFTVTGPDMSPMKEIVDVQGQDTITVVFVVPNGPDRCFRIDALDGDGRLLYSGVTCADIQGPTSVTVYMRTQCDIYVDINTGDDDINDGSIAMPLETITRAIEEAGIREIDNAVICVAAGTYYGSGGYAYAPPPSAPELAVGPGNETFPLLLQSGMSLICTGSDFTTVIDAFDAWSLAIQGATGALIQGCRVIVDNYETGIFSNGPMTIDNVLIEGGGCCAGEGISLGISSDGSVVSNSIIRDINGGGETAIYANDSNVTITDTEISDNASGGIYIDGGVANITGNTIYNNAFGIEVYEADVTVRNSEIYCNWDADLISDSSTQVDAINNSWDHDSTTEPTGPTISSSGSCSGGIDICYWGVNPAPLFDPFNSAVSGGCLTPPLVSKE